MSASPKGVTETSVCVRCTNHITMGHAYELGGNRWHTHCFSCYKCDKPLSCDSDFLVLGTSDLICFECSDSCKCCGKKIDDLAIILASSNEAYCSDCFKCCKCGEKINDLRYAKTKKGLFCITCHERLLARKKYHEEKKRRLKKQLPIVPNPSLTHFLSSLDPSRIESSGEETANNNNMNSSLDPGLDLTPESDPYSETPSSAPDRSKSRSTTADLLQHKHIHDSDYSYGQDQNVMEGLQQSPAASPTPPPQKIITAPIDFSKKDSIVKSNSNSVIAQFLDDEYHHDDESVTTEHRHSASQLDKILQNTLDNSEEDTLQISPTFNSSDILPSSLRQPSDSSVTVSRAELEQHLTYSPQSSINKTPSHSSVKSPSYGLQPPKSPDVHRHAMVFETDSYEDINTNQRSTAISNVLKTPKGKNKDIEEDSLLRTPKFDSEPRPTGLGISTPKSLQKFKLSSSLSIISPRTEVIKQTSTIGVPYDSLDEKPPTSSNTEHSSVVNNSAPDHHRRTSSGAKNITRSLSFRSKNLISNLRSKTKSSNSPNRSTDKDFDTHSGWGVASVHPAIDESSSSLPTGSSRRRISSRGQSDSTIYSHLPAEGNQQSHIRSQSGSNKVSMFRTPPLGSATSGTNSHNKSLSIDGSNNTVIPEDEKAEDGGIFTPAAKELFGKDVKTISLQLRKLNMEVNELQLTKAQLTADIEKLRTTKDILTTENESLRKESKDLKHMVPSQESLPEETYDAEFNGNGNSMMSPTKNQLTSASSSSVAKPRFWKLFGSGNANVRQVNSNSSKSVEISAPMLQNPNEFDDLKLLPIQNSGSNDSVPSNSLSSTGSDGQTLYGSSLVLRCAYEKRDVPLIITTCLDYIESDPELMMTEGIYRKTGSQVLIEQFEKMFAEEERVDFARLNTDVHAVTSVLKRYLRKLPNPIFSYQCYESLVNLVRDNSLLTEIPLNKNTNQPTIFDNILEKLCNVLRTLPIQHLITLRLLCNHLEHIMKYKEDNLMNLHNLALVFAPGLIKDYTGEKDIIDMKERNYLIGFVLLNYREIYHVLQQNVNV